MQIKLDAHKSEPDIEIIWNWFFFYCQNFLFKYSFHSLDFTVGKHKIEVQSSKKTIKYLLVIRLIN